MYRIGYAAENITDWTRRGIGIGIGPYMWNETNVRSSSMLYIAGYTLAAYEGYDETGVNGIGLALAQDDWINSESDNLTFTKPFDSPVESQVLRIENLGLSHLDIFDVSVSDDSFQITTTNVPVNIAPYSFVEWEVQFTGNLKGHYRAEVIIESSDRNVPSLIVPLYGEVR